MGISLVLLVVSGFVWIQVKQKRSVWFGSAEPLLIAQSQRCPGKLNQFEREEFSFTLRNKNLKSLPKSMDQVVRVVFLPEELIQVEKDGSLILIFGTGKEFSSQGRPAAVSVGAWVGKIQVSLRDSLVEKLEKST